jgi:hypothetical protein
VVGSALVGGQSLFLYWFFYSACPNIRPKGQRWPCWCPPIGFLAAWTYDEQGYVDLRIASLICIGFFFGGLIGVKFAVKLSNVALERVFGGALLLISLK